MPHVIDFRRAIRARCRISPVTTFCKRRIGPAIGVSINQISLHAEGNRIGHHMLPGGRVVGIGHDSIGIGT